DCIDSIVKHTSNYRLIFVDDNSDDIGRECISDIASQFRDSVLVRTHFQHWYTRAYNLGLNMVKAPYAVMINSDIVVHEGWLDTFYSNLEAARESLLLQKLG